MGIIVGKITQRGERIYSENKKISNQYSENLELDVDLTDTFYDGYSLIWLYAYDKELEQSGVLGYDSVSKTITLPKNLLARCGTFYVSMRAVKEDVIITTNPIYFYITESINPNTTNIPTELGWEEVAKSLMEQVFRNEYEAVLNKLVDDTQTLVSGLQTKIAIGNFKGDAGVMGPKGDKGDKGDTGLTGPIGPKGDQGIQGIQGPKGDKGDIGPIGLTGPKGDKGDVGLTGATGLTGTTGTQGPIGLTGPVGPQGPPGEKGLKGDQGIQGPIGLTGPVGPQGEKGDQGLQGIQGPIGPSGLQGEQGLTGATGITGSKGDKGDKGDIGLTGPKGDKGDTGLTGPQGIQGPKGEKGDQGVQGIQGPMGNPGETIVTEPTIKIANPNMTGTANLKKLSSPRMCYLFFDLLSKVSIPASTLTDIFIIPDDVLPELSEINTVACTFANIFVRVIISKDRKRISIKCPQSITNAKGSIFWSY